MKNISFVVNGVLALAVALLFILHFNQQKRIPAPIPEDNSMEDKQMPEGEMKIAYVYIDSLLTHYKMAQDMSTQLLKKKNNLESELTTKGQTLEKKIADYQYKVQKGLITSWDAADQEKMLAEQQQVFVNLQNDMQNRLMTEEQDANLKVHNSVIQAVKEYNSTKGYKLIFSHAFGGVLLYAEDYMNITGEILEKLNDAYEVSK